MRRSVPIIAIVAAALVTPVGAASWGAYGGHEPDNALDIPSLMWADAPAPGERKVYFAAFSTTWGFANNNIAALETSMETMTLEYHEAIFGVWVDCNGDGYVGMAESALVEYDARLLLDDSVCPRVEGAAGLWSGAHNYNGWVSEFVPIGGFDPDEGSNAATDLRVYRDPQAMVWGDYGRPTDGASAGGTCAVTPIPRGTLSSTGGILNYVGCPYPGVSARWNEVILGRQVMGVFQYPGLDPSNSNNLANNGDWRNSALEHPTLGTEDSSNSPATVWDCSREEVNETNTGLVVPGISPGVGNTQNPTVPGLVNHTMEGVPTALGDDCDTSNDRGADTYGLLEGDFNGVSGARKTEADWNLRFDDAQRGSPWGFVLGRNGASGTQSDFGVQYLQNAGGFLLNNQAPSMWYSDSTLLKRGPRTAAVNTYTGDADIPDPYHLTFYAHYGAATAARGFTFPGGSGVYGSSQCGDNDSGIHNGWVCDVNLWYQNPDGSFIPEPYPYARPGQTYELRDVDCYDGGNSLGVALGTPAYGENPCT